MSACLVFLGMLPRRLGRKIQTDELCTLFVVQGGCLVAGVRSSLLAYARFAFVSYFQASGIYYSFRYLLMSTVLLLSRSTRLAIQAPCSSFNTLYL